MPTIRYRGRLNRRGRNAFKRWQRAIDARECSDSMATTLAHILFGESPSLERNAYHETHSPPTFSNRAYDVPQDR